jgi:hypothetical protein
MDGLTIAALRKASKLMQQDDAVPDFCVVPISTKWLRKLKRKGLVKYSNGFWSFK